MKKKNKKNIIIILVFFVLIIAFVLLIKYTRIFKNKITSDDIPDVEWPFKNLKDENDKNLNILCITAHMDDTQKKTFVQYIDKGIKFIGICSYLSFPRKCDNHHGFCHLDKDIKINGKYIEDYVLGWCHCFREPDKYIKGNKPKILLSESDFHSERLEIKNDMKIIYDYIVLQPKDSDECDLKWHAHNKNWELAEKCIKILSDDLNLKGLICGRDNCPINIEKKENIEVVGFIDYYSFIDKVRQSRFFLLPNLEDASPRVITESLCLNKPIFVNENILGGWKYVNNKTGVFFNENNIKKQVETLLKNYDNYSPREYFINNHGNVNSGKQLKKFIKSVYPELTSCKHVKFAIA